MSDGWIAANWSAPPNIVAGTVLRNGRFEDCALAGEPCWLQQVHGAGVVVAARFGQPPEADASISCNPDNICVVRTADCLPVLLCASDGTEVAAVHAGWRGLAAGVIEATIARLQHAPDDLLAWLGPAISQAAFEVGDEVRAAFLGPEPDDARHFVANSRGRWQADLYGLAGARLHRLGVGSIAGGGSCTYTDRARFFSYRRNPDCGRMVSFVALQGLEK
ncbi:MAG: peptidoglycan editing factor PgeF [Woeseiaceae bacterium]